MFSFSQIDDGCKGKSTREQCFFASLKGFPQVECGPQRRHKAESWDIQSCNDLADIGIDDHLTSWKVYREKLLKNELDLILWRANQTEQKSKNCKSWLICPAHRESLGNGWRTSKSKCQNVLDNGRKCNSAGNKGANSNIVKKLIEKNQFCQIGERKYFHTL